MAASRGESAVNVKEWRKRVTAAFGRPSRFIDYYQAPEWANGVSELFDDLRQLLDDGHAAAVIPLVEYAFERADRATQYVDSSDGYFSDFSWYIEDLHLRACLEVRPDPVALAGRLVDFERNGELDTFRRAAQTYAQVLGAKGLAEYRRLIQPAYEALEPRREHDYSSERSRLTDAMLGLARASRDPEEFIAIASTDLRSPHAFEEIVEILTEAERITEAIDWAYQGLAMEGREFQKGKLREQLVELLVSTGAHDAAVKLRLEAFHSLPSLSAYKVLLTQTADADGDRNAQRVEALDWLRGRAIEEDGTAYGSVLVEILLYEGEIDAAWDTAGTVGCTDAWWRTLARARSKDHPQDAIPVYERFVEQQIELKKANAYAKAVKLMIQLQRLHDATGDNGWEPYLVELTERHKRKTSLMAKIHTKWK